jgi:hypothetical protein
VGGGHVDVGTEGDGQFGVVLAILGLSVEVALALVGVGDEVDGDFGNGVGGLLGAVVVLGRALRDDLGHEFDVLAEPEAPLVLLGALGHEGHVGGEAVEMAWVVDADVRFHALARVLGTQLLVDVGDDLPVRVPLRRHEDGPLDDLHLVALGGGPLKRLEQVVQSQLAVFLGHLDPVFRTVIVALLPGYPLRWGNRAVQRYAQ